MHSLCSGLKWCVYTISLGIYLMHKATYTPSYKLVYITSCASLKCSYTALGCLWCVHSRMGQHCICLQVEWALVDNHTGWPCELSRYVACVCPSSLCYWTQHWPWMRASLQEKVLTHCLQGQISHILALVLQHMSPLPSLSLPLVSHW